MWSTNLDAVTSQGTYNIIPVGNVLYNDNGTFYIIDNNGEYQPSTAPFDEKLSYYIVKKNDKGEIEYADKDKT